ncbi:Os09g0555550, partial [Oryza sativa Japonica Group]
TLCSDGTAAAAAASASSSSSAAGAATCRWPGSGGSGGGAAPLHGSATSRQPIGLEPAARTEHGGGGGGAIFAYSTLANDVARRLGTSTNTRCRRRAHTGD